MKSNLEAIKTISSLPSSPSMLMSLRPELFICNLTIAQMLEKKTAKKVVIVFPVSGIESFRLNNPSMGSPLGLHSSSNLDILFRMQETLSLQGIELLIAPEIPFCVQRLGASFALTAPGHVIRDGLLAMVLQFWEMGFDHFAVITPQWYPKMLSAIEEVPYFVRPRIWIKAFFQKRSMPKWMCLPNCTLNWSAVWKSPLTPAVSMSLKPFMDQNALLSKVEQTENWETAFDQIAQQFSNAIMQCLVHGRSIYSVFPKHYSWIVLNRSTFRAYLLALILILLWLLSMNAQWAFLQSFA